MHVVVDQSVLAKSLSRVAGIVERKNSIPIISNVALSAKNGTLSITGTDLDMEARTSINLMIDAEGTCTVPAATLADIVKRLPEGSQVEMVHDSEQGQMTVRAGRSRFSLSTLPVEDFPWFGDGAFSHTFEMDTTILASMIDSARFAVSTEETRYYLNGIYLHQIGEEMRMAATDGHRLARTTTPLPHNADGIPGVIIPRKAVGEIRKTLDGKGVSGAVSIDLSETKLRISYGSTVLSTKLIDGTFPDYERVIPTGNTCTMEADSAELSAAIERVSAISSEKSRAIKMTLAEGEITIAATSSENGSATDTLDSERSHWNGPPIEIGFNGRYMMDIIAAAGCDRLTLAMADSASPCVITNSANDGAKSLFVLMPMRV